MSLYIGDRLVCRLQPAH